MLSEATETMQLTNNSWPCAVVKDLLGRGSQLDSNATIPRTKVVLDFLFSPSIASFLLPSLMRPYRWPILLSEEESLSVHVFLRLSTLIRVACYLGPSLAAAFGHDVLIQQSEKCREILSTTNKSGMR